MITIIVAVIIDTILTFISLIMLTSTSLSGSILITSDYHHYSHHYRHYPHHHHSYLTGMLLKAGPTQWILQETKEMAEMNFRFVDKIDAASYVTRLANSMQISSPEHIVSGVDAVLCLLR